MRVKIIPHGSLLETWPTDFECEARSPAQALNALDRQFKLAPKGRTFSQVRLVGIESEVALNSPCTMTEYHVVPDFSGGGGFIKIILGAILIAVSFFVGPVTGNILLGLGISLVLGGIMELLSPAPKLTSPKNTGNSIYLGAPLNTTQIGTRILIGYGTFAVYGQYLSYQIQSTQTATNTSLSATLGNTQSWNNVGSSLNGHSNISSM